jgi:hypothetical protein
LDPFAATVPVLFGFRNKRVQCVPGAFVKFDLGQTQFEDLITNATFVVASGFFADLVAFEVILIFML